MRASVFVFCLGLLSVGAAQADSLNVRFIGGCTLPDYAGGVAVVGDHAYVADFNSGLRVISVADPSHPAEIGSLDTPGRALDVAVVGNHAYVADGAAGLRIVSVADPAHPVEVGYCDTPTYAQHVVALGGYAYVADNSSGLRVISVSDPAHPTEVGHCDVPGLAVGLDVEGGYAYVADYDSGLRVISIADPAHPVEVGSFDSTTSASGVDVRDGYAYTVDEDAGLWVISVADPMHPTRVKLVSQNLFFARDVAVVGGIAYVGAGTLRILSVADPANPAEVGFYRTSREVRGVAVAGGYIYATSRDSLLSVFQFYGGGVEETMSDERGTMNSLPTIVRGVLRLPAAASLKPQASSWLLDASGRKVLGLKPGANDVGGLVPGVYFVRDPGSRGRGFEDSRATKVVVAR